MSKNKNDLDFELDFLDQNSKEFESDRKRVQKIVTDQEHEAEKAAKKASAKKNSSWGVIAAVVVIGFIVWGVVSDSGSSCTPQDPATVASLQPAASEETYINNESSRLDTVSNQLDSQKAQLDSSTINDYSPQYLIDIYNIQVASYNSKLRQYQSDVATYNVRRNAYNSKVDAYNSYLGSHCTN